MQYRLERGMRRAALSAGAGLAFLVGAGFLTVAAWIVLAETASALAAALVLGGLWTGAGFFLFGLARMRRVPPAAPPPARVVLAADGLGLAQAFLIGLEAGRGRARKG